ncbi:hypothetical protein TTHERM_01104940 (macronuclear) [Tetrahymena thermophila SB210]|uniref:Uncharacterized protein n=1 Tax=Tetrahymena thermophila (strain SB210) TaxID=312017 RepID=Q24D65_TETTS|nr:hypothetical protein TTHERM_01104940 [Tetrahymena thermophila SB210]EAS05724.2 hypothetical protein TTHERM_01104940 [Tetrahymena thermophila SB210]|eukprot:XP_001025969.2 hypothetical protein TTHERM_01104940 [Tetrahymena thermophila SB210]
MKYQNSQAKQIKINIANVYKLYKDEEFQKKNAKQNYQNILPQNQMIVQAKVDENHMNYHKFRGQLQTNQEKKEKNSQQVVIIKKQGSDVKIHSFQTPRTTISSTYTSATIKSNFPIKNSRKSDEFQILTPKSMIQKERASSLISDKYMEYSQKGNEVQKVQAFSTNRKLYQNQNLISKIKCLLSNYNNKKDSNKLFKTPIQKNQQTKTDQSLQRNIKSLYFKSQDEIEDIDQDNEKQVCRINNFIQQQQPQRTNRSNQADNIIYSIKKQQSQSQDTTPYISKLCSENEIAPEYIDSKFCSVNDKLGSQHMIYDDASDRKYQRFSGNKKLSMCEAISNYEAFSNENRLSDIIRGKSNESSSPRNASQQKQLAETNQFKIKLLQNLKDQMEVQTDLSNCFQNPLKASRQEKRISQMMSAKLVPNTISSKDLQNICENRQLIKKKPFSSLQQFLESKLPYEQVLERQKQEILVEQNVRKSIQFISRNSPNCSKSNTPSPIRQEYQDQTPISNFILEDNFQASFQSKFHHGFSTPLSPKKSQRVSIDFNHNAFELDYGINQQINEDNSNQDEKQQQILSKLPIHNKYSSLKISKSVSNFTKSPSMSKKKEIDSPIKKQNLLSTYIPSSLIKKKCDLEKNINKIKFKSLLSFAESSNQAIFEIEKNQNLKNVIDQNLKKLSPYKQKTNSKIFRFETNNTEPECYQNNDNKEIFYSPRSQQQFK